LLVPLCETFGWLGFWLFLFGACSGAMYPLGLSLLDANFSADRLAKAYAWYLAMECVGSQLGAAAMGAARDLWGGGAMFGVAALALASVLAVGGGLRLSSRPAASRADDMQRAA
jgi:hypothetical protein